MRVPAFIATLGMSSVSARSLWSLTHEGYILDGPTSLRTSRGTSWSVCHSRLSTWFSIAVAALVFLNRLPVGRRLYAVGGNRRAAELTGISVSRYLGSVCPFGSTRGRRRGDPRCASRERDIRLDVVTAPSGLRGSLSRNHHDPTWPVQRARHDRLGLLPRARDVGPGESGRSGLGAAPLLRCHPDPGRLVVRLGVQTTLGARASRESQLVDSRRIGRRG